MKQRRFDAARDLGIFQQDGAGLDQRLQVHLRQRGRLHHARPGALGPDRAEMALARPGRTEQQQDTVRPLGKAFEHVPGLGIGGRDKKILAAEPRLDRQIEGKLARRHHRVSAGASGSPR